MSPKRILLVCTGNLCRSPMAEGFLRRMLKERGLNGKIEVASAGTSALEGEPATPLAIYVMAQQGIPISSHRSHRITPEDITSADLVLTMTQEHYQFLSTKFPQGQRRIRLLSEMAGVRSDIEDPIYSQNIDNYTKCAEAIRDYLEWGLPRILDLVGINAAGW
ncbi:MAG: low molecular weight protein arginine phosphatase [Chloroflexi bacterium]|nr:low molecular weight protein arginine phosphatase [Chloroflexota bacterium]